MKLQQVLVAVVLSVFCSHDAWACAERDRHERWPQKIRSKPSAARLAAATRVTITEMLRWPANKQALPILDADAEVVALEKQLVAVTGWVRRARKDPGDCDIHVELSGTRTAMKRVIVEIPFNQAATVRQLETVLGRDDDQRL